MANWKFWETSGKGAGSSPEDEMGAHGRTDVSMAQRFLRGMDLHSSPAASLSNPYTQSIATFTCINVISTSLARVPFVHMRGDAEADDSDIARFMMTPNHLQDINELLSTVVVQLLTSGNAFIFIDEGNSKGMPISLLPLPPALVKVDRQNLFDIEGYLFQAERNKDPIKIPRENIIHIKFAPNPSDPVLGISPLDVAVLTIETDFSASIFNKSLLEGGGLPAGLLRYTGQGRMSEDARDELTQQWQRAYGGPRGAGKIAVTSGEWQWQHMGVAMKDMQHLEGRKWNLQEIARAFGVPLIYLNDFDGVGFGEAGLQVLEKLFYSSNIKPLASKICRAFNRQFYEIHGKGVTCDFDFSNVEALRDDFATKVEAAQRLQKMGWSINKINKRCELGLEDEDWGDEHLSPMNMVPTRDIVNHEVSIPGDDLSDNSDTGIGDDAAPEGNDAPPVEEEEDEFGEAASMYPAMMHNITAINSRCENRVRRSLMSLRSDITASVTGSNLARDQMINSKIIESFTESMGEAYVHGVKSLLNNSLFNNDLQTSNLATLRSEAKSLSEHYVKLRKGHILKVIEGIGESLDAFINEEKRSGTPDSEIQTAVKKKLNKITRRIHLLSSAEVFSAFNSARYVASRKLGTKSIRLMKKPSSKCPVHKKNGERVKVGELLSSGQRFPGDFHLDNNSTLECDCTFIAEAA